MPGLLHPEDARSRCARQFAREHRAWLGQGGGTGWPQTIRLGAPGERDAAADPAAVRAWALAWSDWEARGETGRVLWDSRQWPRLGSQRLPRALELAAVADVARLAGQADRWERAVARWQRLAPICAGLAGQAVSQRLFDALADGSEPDFECLLALMRWTSVHPASGLLLRQLPVVGLHTKWIEQRRGLITDLQLARSSPSNADTTGRDLLALLGLRRPPPRVRLRLLDGELRWQVGGLGDIEAPIGELARLPIAPRLALVVENLDSGLALPDLPGAVVLMKLGHAVALLQQLPWLGQARVVLWGDIDTHGFAILDRARAVLPQLESMLMDRQTLLTHRALWVEEPQPHAGPELQRLTASEREVHEGLQRDTWGLRVRLEQERLPWSHVLEAIKALQAR